VPDPAVQKGPDPNDPKTRGHKKIISVVCSGQNRRTELNGLNTEPTLMFYRLINIKISPATIDSFVTKIKCLGSEGKDRSSQNWIWICKNYRVNKVSSAATQNSMHQMMLG